MHKYIFILVLLLFGYVYNRDLTESIDTGHEQICLIEEIYGNFTNEELSNLIMKRKKVRNLRGKILHRIHQETLYVPVVFHNLYKTDNGIPVNSYCDYGYNVVVNNPDICNDRILYTLEVLNAQYLPANIQFQLHHDYSTMLHDTIPGLDGFFEDASNGNATGPTPNAIKSYYNIPNALNIYTHKCLPGSDTSCIEGKLGFATYPWSLDDNEPGVFIKHESLPGSADIYSSSQIGILAHEIGHFFSLLHINGTWFLKNTNTPRELVSGGDCEIHGDLICDTPGSPGYVPINSDPDSLQSWYLNSNDRQCIYHGYGGNFNTESGILKIGGYNISYNHGTYPSYNYCEEWDFEEPIGLEENCELFTNYDDQGNFFGTRDLPIEYLNEDKSIYASESPIEQYSYLPKGNNFMQSGTITLYSCSPRPIGHDDYDASNHGFTLEQFANIRYSLEQDYTGCNITTACNYDRLSFFDNLCRYPCPINNGCLSIDSEYIPDHNLYNCDGICISDIDDDGICDHLEVVGCQNEDACNYNEFATDPDTTDIMNGCVYPQEFYDCNGNCVNDIDDDGICDENMPDYFSITNIYPNPFNPITTIRYGLYQDTNVQISIYDITGRLLTTLIKEFHTKGYHSIKWEASNSISGIYFIKMSSGNHTESRKVVLIK